MMKNVIAFDRKFSRRVRPMAGLLALILVLLALAGPSRAALPTAQGALIVVNSYLDVKQNNDGLCTLREAIIAANSDKKSGGKSGECEAGAGADTIMLDSGTYVLTRSDNGNEDAATTGDLDIFSDVTLVGHGFGQTAIDSSVISDRALHVLSGQVRITDVTVTKKGGLVTGDGAGIKNSGDLTLFNTTVVANEASGFGGGIFNDGLLTLNSSTLSGNSAGSSGGALANAGSGSATLNNSTVSGNSDGIFNQGILALNNATVTANDDGGLVNSSDIGAANLRHTIVSNNGFDCEGAFLSLGYNLAGDTTCQLTGPGDITNVDPRLGPLQANGGQTETHSLLPGSPAIDAGDPAGCFGSEGQLAFDQRGEPRPVDGDFNGSFRCDIGAVEVGRGGGDGQSALILLRAFPDLQDGNDPTVHGLLEGAGNQSLADLDLQLFGNTVCDPANPGLPLAFTIPPGKEQTDENGYFIVDNVALSGQTYLTARATAPDGLPLQSNCVPFNDRNDDWPNATLLTPNPVDFRDNHFIDAPGQSRWYKFKVRPSSDLTIVLSGTGGPDDPLPANYDLTLYKDLQAAFDAIVDPSSQDIVRLSAQYAGSAYSGSAYSGSAYSGSAYSGSAYSGSAYSGSAYSGSAYSGSAYSGSAYSGSAYSGSAYSGSAYSGSAYSGSAYSGSAYSGSAYSGSAYSDAIFGGSAYSEAYSDAQARTLLAVSAIGGATPETIFLRTWNSDEYYYLRVRSSNGEFSLAEPFRIEVRLEPSAGCSNIDFDHLNLPATSLAAGGNGYETLILTDNGRLNNPALFDEGAGGALTTLQANLAALAGQSSGVIVDVGTDARVTVANALADANPECPFAKNLAADAVKKIVEAYKVQNPLKYLVIVGNDNIIPFYRHPDFADLAKESQYVPPVVDSSASQAALRLDYYLSDDAYVAREMVPLGNSTFPIVDPNFAAGRLVETAAEMNAVIEAFLSSGGVVAKDEGAGESWSTLTTGYDFLEDTARAIRDQLNGATNNSAPAAELITPFEVPPTDASAWSADELRAELFDSGHHDLIFLAGHFAAHSALAADYRTELFADELTDPALPADLFNNTVVFSIGCHAGYNLVNEAEVPGIPRNPDWASALASQGATLVAGTSYQYGETLTQEYSERLYIEFAKQLRRDTGGPIPIGPALNRAKLAYITQVPSIRGTHEKSLLVATVFGLPMLSFDLPGRANPPGDSSVVAGLTAVSAPPGSVTGLEYYDLNVTSPLNVNPVELTDIDTKQVLNGEFLSGNDGEVTNPTEPFLPLEIENVTVPGATLRGVGFRGGSYEDVFNILPVTGAPTTEAIALHLSWQTPYLHPTRLDNANYLGALVDGQQRILFTPAQHIQGDRVNIGGADVRLSHRRQFSQMEYRLFYNNDTTEFCADPANPTPDTCHTPAFSAPPTIVRVSAIPGEDEVTFRAMVVGDPAAGIQGVWVTWSTALDAPGSGRWQSLDLRQREADTRMWEGRLPLNGLDPAQIRYMVQAVNAYGLVSQDLNRGDFFTPGQDSEPTIDTTLTLEAPNDGLFDTLVDVSATLKTAGGQPLAGQTVEFRFGPGLSAVGTTDAAGRARANVNLVGLPGPQKLYASFAGRAPYKSASAVKDFEILKQQVRIEGLSDALAFLGEESGIVVRLVDEQGEPLREQGLFLVVTQPPAETPLFVTAGITDLFGRASLGTVPLNLASGQYQLTVYFNDPANPLTQRLTSDVYQSARESAQLTLAPSPCDTANNPTGIVPFLTDPSDPDNHPSSIWAPNGEFWRVDLLVADSTIPAGLLDVAITGIFQDEPVGNNGPDGQFISVEDTDRVLLRARRDGNGDGRVYHLEYTASNGQGFSCDGVELIPVVPHDQSEDPAAFDSAPPLYDSTAGPRNDPPVAVDDNGATDEDTAVVITVLANDTDPDNKETLSVIQVGQPANGTAAVNPDSTITYTPNPDYNGNDNFTYQASDGALSSNVATVTVTINPVNDPPLANDDVATTGPNTAVIIEVLANDSDVDGAVDQASITVVSGPANGTAASNGDGTITYTPADGFINADDSFVYQVCDNEGACSPATVIVTVTGNSPPVARDDAVMTDEDVPVAIDLLADNGNGPDTDAEEGSPDPTTVNIEVGPAHGAIVVDPSGMVTYSPNENFSGFDTFSYTVKDSGGLSSNVATVTITINAIPDPPVAGDDQAVTDEGVAVEINVLANDSGTEGAIDPTTVFIAGQPANGTISVDPGSGVVTYSSNSGFSGADSFTYTVADETGLISNVAAVTITVTDQNEPPKAVDDAVATPQGAAVIIPVLANDTDPDGDSLTVAQFTQGKRGTVTANADGTLTYTPSSNFRGEDSFSYTISDGRGGTDTATVNVTTTN